MSCNDPSHMEIIAQSNILEWTKLDKDYTITNCTICKKPEINLSNRLDIIVCNDVKELFNKISTPIVQSILDEHIDSYERVYLLTHNAIAMTNYTEKHCEKWDNDTFADQVLKITEYGNEWSRI